MLKSRPARSAALDPSPRAFAYSFAEARKLGGPSRSRAYELEREGKLVFVRMGRRTKIDGDSLRAYLASCRAKPAHVMGFGLSARPEATGDAAALDLAALD